MENEKTNFTDLAAEEDDINVKPIASKEILSIITSDLFDQEACEKILSTAIDELWMKIKVVGDEDLHSGERQKLRGDISKFPFEDIRAITKEANDKVFDFDLLGIIDQDYPQLFRYTEGSYHNWHVDINPLAPTRKLSFIINLNKEFEGGNIEFLNTTHEGDIMDKQGTIIIFPSFLPYRISKITSGTKYIIAGHIHGSLFK